MKTPKRPPDYEDDVIQIWVHKNKTWTMKGKPIRWPIIYDDQLFHLKVEIEGKRGKVQDKP